MKSAIVSPSGNLEIVEMEIPRPGPGEVLVKMVACGICGTDLEKLRKGTLTPPVLGHEVAGIVKEVGTGVDVVKPGDRVFIHHHVPCGSCWYCSTGSETMCPFFTKTNIYPGGFSEYLLVPKENVERGALHILEKNIDWVTATFAEPLGTVIRGLSKVRFRKGYSVAILGLGPIGLLYLLMFRAMGASYILGLEPSSLRRKKAKELGIDECHDPANINIDKLRSSSYDDVFDLIVIATGNYKALALGLELARRGGEILLFGAPPPGFSMELPLYKIFYNEIKITPSYSTTEKEIEIAIKLLRKINVKKLVTHIYPMSKIEKAFLTASDPTKAIKVIVVSDENYEQLSLSL